MKHVMVDVETLGHTPRAILVSIGAVMFYSTGATVGTFHGHIALSENDLCVSDVSLSTITWWMQQSDEARHALFNPARSDSLPSTLFRFVEWYKKIGPTYVWARPASFDIPILEHNLRQCHIPVPWSYRQVQCARTALTLAGIDQKDFPPTVAHDALSDAVAQTVALTRAFKQLGFGEEGACEAH